MNKKINLFTVLSKKNIYLEQYLYFYCAAIKAIKLQSDSTMLILRRVIQRV